MLNKLLKRCMPWMDKGRWYKLTLVKNNTWAFSDTDESRSDDDLSFNFYSANVSNSMFILKFASTENVGFIIKDLRIELTSSNNNVVDYATVPYLSRNLKESNLTQTVITCYNVGDFAEDYDTLQFFMYAEKVTV